MKLTEKLRELADHQMELALNIPIESENQKVTHAYLIGLANGLRMAAIEVERLKLDELLINPAYQTLHISGDCLCGSFSDQTEVDLLLAFYPDLAKRLGDLEKRRAAVTPIRCKYGGTKGSKGVSGTAESLVCSECQDK